MKESIKKYSKYLIGYAYQVFSYEIETYLVIKKDKIKFIPYISYDFGSPKRKKEIINTLEEEGYKDISFYKEESVKLILKQ